MIKAETNKHQRKNISIFLNKNQDFVSASCNLLTSWQETFDCAAVANKSFTQGYLQKLKEIL